MSEGARDDRRPEKFFELESPEAVRLRFPLAELGARALAFAVDIALILCVTALVVSIGMLILGLTGRGEGLIIVSVGMFLIRHFYFVAFEVLWHGATPGKRIMRLRVVSRDGGGLNVDAVVTRNLVRDVELFVPLLLALAPEQAFGDAPSWIRIPAVLWTLVIALLPVLTRERTRAGDLVGGTVVVRVPAAQLLADQAARISLAPQAPSAIELTHAQLSVYGEKELEVLADLIRTVERGGASLADQRIVARTIAKKIAYDGPEPQHDPTRFLTSFYKQQRAALEKRLLFGKRKASKHDA